MSLPSLGNAISSPPNYRKGTGIASLAFGILASLPLGSFLGAQVAAASATSVSGTMLWGSAVNTIGVIAIFGGVPIAGLAIAFGLAALVRNGRIGKGCGLAGFLLGASVVVWLAIAVWPQLF